MTGIPEADRTETLTDPETLCDRDGVDVREQTHDVDAEEFEDVTDLDSHVAVGTADDRGVLLQNDGHHGWTLPAFAVEPDDDWLAVARRGFESLTSTTVAVDAVERVRRLEYRVPDTDQTAVVWNVVVRATLDDSLPDDPETNDEGIELRWFDEVPDDAPEAVADDIECVATADTSLEMTETLTELTDPESLLNRDDIDVCEESVAVPSEAFEHYAAADGVSVVGVTNDDDAVLLWTDPDHGWLLPAAPVEPGEDYVVAARGVVERLAGVAVDVTGVERVRRVEYAADEAGDDRETTVYYVVFGARGGDDPLPVEPPGTDESDADWFAHEPDDLHGEDEASDVRLFVP
ncbi:hypothetical protein HALDL1_02310 [Halobacterium sp. DL1]|jgi:hypothetical protein|nr:hypothetical protein HALDL1_02310 [Halobacterium sp. DL1]